MAMQSSVDRLKVIYFQEGPYENFPLVIEQAMRWGNDVVVLCDDMYLNKLPCETVDFRKYMYQAGLFRHAYHHLSTLDKTFELRCFLRWFAMSEYAQEELAETLPIFTADSDVMIFCNLAEEYARNWKDYHFTLSMGTWAGSSFWSEPVWLDLLCDFMYEVYRHPESKRSKAIFQHYYNRQAEGKPGGVCDMTLCEHFARHSEAAVGETSDIRGGTTFDHNIIMDHQGGWQFTYSDGTKDVWFPNGRPTCVAAKDEGGTPQITMYSDVVFNTLHCSRHTHLIPEFYEKGKR